MPNQLCRTATQLLQSYFAEPLEHHLDVLLQHLEVCEVCSFQPSFLWEALQTAGEDELTCEACLAQLPEYIHASETGIEAVQPWLAVTRHLNTCPSCAREYEALREWVALAEEEMEEDFAAFSSPDLSFLREPPQKRLPSPPKLWHIDALGALIIEFSAKVVASLISGPPLAIQGLKGRNDEPHRLVIDGALEILRLRAEIAVLSPDDATYTLLVRVIPQGLSWPHLAGHRVVLEGPGYPARVQMTDPYGEAVFSQIPKAVLPEIRIRIEPGRTGASQPS